MPVGYNVAHTKHDCTSRRCIINCNTSITVHKQGTVAYPLHSTCQGQLQTTQSVSVVIPVVLPRMMFAVSPTQPAGISCSGSKADGA